MSDSHLLDVFVECPRCAAVNRLVATPLPESHTMRCSQCGASLGEVGALKQAAGDAAPARSAPPQQRQPDA